MCGVDLPKALNCLSNGIIANKLHAYGLELLACKLLFSYLCGKKQHVKISNRRNFWAVFNEYSATRLHTRAPPL